MKRNKAFTIPTMQPRNHLVVPAKTRGGAGAHVPKQDKRKQQKQRKEILDELQ